MAALTLVLCMLACSGDEPAELPTTTDTDTDTPDDTDTDTDTGPTDTAPPPPPVPLELCINELMPDNEYAWDDGTELYPDWVELHNPGTEDVSLDGWSLTDDREEPDLHPLDGLVVAAGGFLILQASGDEDLGPDHLSFSLSSDGEELGLFREDGSAEILVWGNIGSDISVSRSTDCGPIEDLVEVYWGTPGGTNTPPDPIDDELVPQGSTWSYRAVEPGLAPVGYTDPAFDDSAWPTGAGPLGYGEDYIVTQISFGTDSAMKWPTSWYRSSFEVTDVDEIVEVRLGVLRDDAVLIHLDGEELIRDNLPEGEISAFDFASASTGGENNYRVYLLDPALLTEGTHSFAAEVHQATPDSSDMSFDLWLEVTRVPAEDAGSTSSR